MLGKFLFWPTTVLDLQGDGFDIPAGGPRVESFASGPGWVLKCEILTLENFVYLT